MRRLVLLSSPRVGAPKTRHVLVVDHHASFAEALACRLDAEQEMHASAATTIEQAQRVLAEHETDVLLLNIEIGGGDCMAFVRHALTASPGLRVVAITGSDAEEHIVEAVRAGVSGWVPKSESLEHLLSVICGTLAGETWIPPRLLTRVIAELRSAQGDHASTVNSWTP